MRDAPNPSLRAWQVEALARYEVRQPRDFLATATPGAGKTTFALTVARRLLKEQRIVDRVIVVAPTDHLRTQWADAATREGLLLDPTLKNSDGPVRAGTDGYVTTYAQVAARAMVHHRRTDARRTLVILDEIHHAGDGLSWGDAISTAFDPACRRLALTGTPFRTNPAERIPFVDYDATTPDELVSVADYTYGYKSALADGVVRPVVFAAYTGISRWMNNAGEVITASLSDSDNRLQEEQAWRTALDPNGQWIPHVLAALDERITYLRQTGMPDAAGLVLASDQDAARAYADVAHRVTGDKPVVILSDDPHASRKIERFATSDERLAICVRMVTEGVDIQRAAVLGYFTSYRTPLFFAQAIGRVVRARTARETATVFLPSVRPLLVLAAEMEAERDHIVRVATSKDNDLNGVTVEFVRSVAGPPAFEALGAEAEFAHVLHAGRAITAAATPGTEISDEDEEFLGLPGLLSPEQTATLLAARDADLRRKVSTLSDNESADRKDSPVSWRDAQELRRELNRLVAQLAARRGRPHAEIHVAARKAVPGPVTAAASTETLMARRDYLLNELMV